MSKAKKIALVAEGTRGDVQPYVALALELTNRRSSSEDGHSCSTFDVRIITNVNHRDFVEGFGITCDAVASDLAKKFADKGALGKSFMTGPAALAEYLWGDSVVPIWRALDDFEPEVVVYGMTTLFIVKAWCEAQNASCSSRNHGQARTVKDVGVFLQLLIPTRAYPPVWFAPHCPYTGKLDNSEDDNWQAWRTFFKGWAQQAHGKLLTKKIAEINDTMLEEQSRACAATRDEDVEHQEQQISRTSISMTSPERCRNVLTKLGSADDYEHLMGHFVRGSGATRPSRSRHIFAISEVAAFPTSRPKEFSFSEEDTVTGFIALQESVQLQRGSDAARDNTVKRLEAFLEQAEADSRDVVYFGWGSMSDNFDVRKVFRMVVRVLKSTGRRGILVSAGLEETDIVRTSDSSENQSPTPQVQAEVQDQAGRAANDAVADSTKDVLLLNAAPHEWLFPRCACIVHHGGCGTSACSLKSGKPTVVVPVMVDQKQWAKNVNELGVGVGIRTTTGGPGELTDSDLVEALDHCLGSKQEAQEIRRKAAELGEKLRKEADGEDSRGSRRAAKVIEEMALR